MPAEAGQQQKTKKQKQGKQPLDLQTAIDQVTRYMRPEVHVGQPQFLGAIYGVYAALPDDANRVRLMAAVLPSFEFAALSGERTPITDYPDLPDGLTVEYIENEMHVAPDGVHEAWHAAEAEFADEPRDPDALGRVAVAFVNKFTDIRSRAHALLHTFSLHEIIEWPAVDLKFDTDDISGEEYRSTVWQHRYVVARMQQALARTKTKSGAGEVLWKLGSSISDERARAIVVGHVMTKDVERRGREAAEQAVMLAQLKQTLGGLFGGDGRG